ncbi:baculoviral IAP repeat-containing protein 1-like isoform X2 [Engystomops pustulosus]|uniref:baculoviral IAP repeat-containing protein 1-like isoform X2 n=1 Tax=Engystomops pustulosus TaxID=76066 RepID=UPI003AFA4E92
MDLININEFDGPRRLVFPEWFLHTNLDSLLDDLSENYRKIREQLPKGPIYAMRSEAKRLRSFLNLPSESSWTANEMASAGFFSTGVENSCQCFCCGLVLCNEAIRAIPMKRHTQFNPDCAFIQGIDVGNISKYDIRPQSIALSPSDHRMQDEQARLQTFSCWPPYTLMEPDVLAQAGFFSTGTRDHVQCFSCGGCLGNWEENDDPWKEHAKWFPECQFLQGQKSKDEIQQYTDNYEGFRGITGSFIFRNIQNSEVQFSTETSICLDFLKKRLTEKYHDRSFQHVSPFGDTISVDLDSQFADICVMLKDTKNQVVRQLILPDILSELNDITMIEGEANSGKTALLRKIAILWASGSCPILSRFSLVFYISLASAESHQTLSDIICQQLIGPSASLTEESLGEITGKLKDKVLFLLDDYGLQDSTPKPVEELILKNPWNRLNLAVTVSTDKGRKLRQYARTTMSIQKFPLYSSIYIVKSFFARDGKEMDAFLNSSAKYKALLTTPLMILAQCSSWNKYPDDNTTGEIHVFKEYVKYKILKFPNEYQAVSSQVSSCGELALQGLFKSKFNFTEIDLRAAGVDRDKAVRYGLLSEFTAQRLHPIYMFSNPSLQEFLAAKRLSELLESEKPEDLDKGLHYLHQVNTFLKMIGPYCYFLRYAAMISTKSTLKIISYVFSLYDNPEALDCHPAFTIQLEKYTDLALDELCYPFAVGPTNMDIGLVFMNILVTFAIESAIEGQCLPDCAPIIIQFLTGKAFEFGVSLITNNSARHILNFIKKYPECMSLLSSIKFYIFAENFEEISENYHVKSMKQVDVPTVERDYAHAYVSQNELVEKEKLSKYHYDKVLSYVPSHILIRDSITDPFKSTGGYKVPIFKVQVNGVNRDNFSQVHWEHFQVLFSKSDTIELELNNSTDFVEHLEPAIEQHLHSFRRLCFCDSYLTAKEQDLILKMSSLESLEIRCNYGIKGQAEIRNMEVKLSSVMEYRGHYPAELQNMTVNGSSLPNMEFGYNYDDNYPEHLIRGIHNFPYLSEVTIELQKNHKVMDDLPIEFERLFRMKKLALGCTGLGTGSSKLVPIIKQFTDLEVLHLSLHRHEDFSGLMNSLSECKKLEELSFFGSYLLQDDMAVLASTMKNFKSLKILDLMCQVIMLKEVSETFAMALGSLCLLEKLLLPAGDGMAHSVKLVIKQLQNVPNLKFLNIVEILDDESIALLEEAKYGNLKKLQRLEMLNNSKVTESGWETFFEEAKHMPELNYLNIDLGNSEIKCRPTTVTSFVRFVSRLPSLVRIIMFGWLLDKDDLDMFNAMKEKHPQSKSLWIQSIKMLPFPPTIED